jgi:hypothetical protein
MIIDNRPKYEEDVDDMTEINDIRNGVIAGLQLHPEFDRRQVVILKVLHFSWLV